MTRWRKVWMRLPKKEGYYIGAYHTFDRDTGRVTNHIGLVYYNFADEFNQPVSYWTKIPYKIRDWRREFYMTRTDEIKKDKLRRME